MSGKVIPQEESKTCEINANFNLTPTSVLQIVDFNRCWCSEFKVTTPQMVHPSNFYHFLSCTQVSIPVIFRWRPVTTWASRQSRANAVAEEPTTLRTVGGSTSGEPTQSQGQCRTFSGKTSRWVFVGNFQCNLSDKLIKYDWALRVLQLELRNSAEVSSGRTRMDSQNLLRDGTVLKTVNPAVALAILDKRRRQRMPAECMCVSKVTYMGFLRS